MGGHAFKNLYRPRINPDVYSKVKSQATAALQTVFTYVVVPTEMPEKSDYGDVDFLVSSLLNSPGAHTIHDFPWEEIVQLIKDALGTAHGRRGYLTNDCMYFAINAPGDEDYFIQIDVKVCLKSALFEWYTFALNYASSGKIFGSMVKPLGLTIDPEGIHIRIGDMEETDHHGSMVWVSKNPKDVLRISGLDHQIIHDRFSTREAIYQYFASSWLFHPAHFTARLAKEKYHERLEDRSAPWMHFITFWIQKHYPGHRLPIDSSASVETRAGSSEVNSQDLQAWYKQTRSAVRDKVFTMFPHVTKEYYAKRAIYLKIREERRLLDLIVKAIPIGVEGWNGDIVPPTVIFTAPISTPIDPGSKIWQEETKPSLIPPAPTPSTRTIDTLPPLCLVALPREPLVPCIQRPPPASMSVEAKLACLARWTYFDPETGMPYVGCSPRSKDMDIWWTGAVDAGATEEMLVRWAKEMWWSVWARQFVVNYVGMWRRRFEKEERSGERVEVCGVVSLRDEFG